MISLKESANAESSVGTKSQGLVASNKMVVPQTTSFDTGIFKKPSGSVLNPLVNSAKCDAKVENMIMPTSNASDSQNE